MPPKKTATAPSKSVLTTASKPLFQELQQLLEKQQQQAQAAAQQEQTYAAAFELVVEQLKELEKPLHLLVQLQKEEQKKRTKSSSSSSTSAASSTTTSASLYPSQPQLDAFATWLSKEAPDSLHGVCWKFSAAGAEPGSDAAEGTGVVAVKALEKGETFMRIPRKVMLTSDGLASSSPVGKYLSIDPMCVKIPSLLLACSLLYEKSLGAASYWATYIQCLPSHFNLPMLWSAETVRTLLQASPTVYDVLVLQRSIIRQYVHLFTTLNRGGLLNETFDFSFHNFQWAVSVVMSRQNRVPPATVSAASSSNPAADSSLIALIPAWDFCNHRGHGEIATFYSVENSASESATMENVAAGQPIHLFYGGRNNAKLLTFAGFVDRAHQSDDMEISLSGDGGSAVLPSLSAEARAARQSALQSDSLLKIKLMLLKKAAMPPQFGIRLPLPDLDASPLASKGGAAASSSSSPEEAQAAAQEARQASRQAAAALMHFLRSCSLATKEHAAAALKFKPSFGNPLTPAFHFITTPLFEGHDALAFEFLEKSLRLSLESYGSSAAEDENALKALEKENNKSLEKEREALSLQMRISEKKLLQQALEKATTWKNKETSKAK